MPPAAVSFRSVSSVQEKIDPARDAVWQRHQKAKRQERASYKEIKEANKHGTQKPATAAKGPKHEKIILTPEDLNTPLGRLRPSDMGKEPTTKAKAIQTQGHRVKAQPSTI